MNPLTDVLAMDERSFRLWAEQSKNAPPFVATPEAATKLVPARKSVGSVAVIPLTGFLSDKPTLFSMLFGGTSVQAFAQEVVSALKDPTVGAVVMEVDSPGGTVHGMTEAAQAIRAARGSKPLVTAASPIMASAAYWIGSQADEIAVSPSALVGGIGVFGTHVSEAKALEQAGLEVTLVSSAPRKLDGNAALPLSDEARAMLQERVDYYGRLFEADVAQGRGVSAKKVAADFGEGAVMTAEAAVKAGVADRVATLEAVVERLAEGYKRLGSGGRAFDETEIDAFARLGGIDIRSDQA